MPVFEIQSPDGTTFEYENDQAPTSDVLDHIFGRAKPKAAPVAPPAPPAAPSFENQLSMPETEGLIRGIPEPAADLLTPSQQIRQMATESTAANQPIGAPVPSTEELVDKERFGLRLGPNAPSVEEAPPTFGELQALGSAGSFLGPEAQRAAVSGLRTVYNNLKGLPEFALSEEGLLTGLASATGPVGRLAVEGYFTYDMAKSLLEQAKQSGQEWDQMSTPQKVSAITQMALTAILTGVIGKAGLKTGAKAIRAPGGLADVVAPIPTPQPRAIYGDVLPPPAERGIPTSVGITEAPPLPEPNVEIANELGAIAQEPVGNFDRYEFPPDAPGKPRAQVAVPKGSPIEVVREKLQAARDRFKEEPAAPAEPTPAPATESKPEVATLATGEAKNHLGDPLGTTYRATPEDWAAWQALQGKKLTEEGVFAERERIKNKYGGMPPQPPAAPTPVEPAPIPDFASKYDRETLMQRPAWVEPGSKLDQVLGELRDKNEPGQGINIAPIWKNLTPKQRQDLASRGWITTTQRDPNAVVLKLAQDVPPARRFYGMQAKRELLKPVEPAPVPVEPAPEAPATTPTGETIAKNLALKYEGTTESPSTGKIDKYVDENGVTVRVPAGTDEAGVAKKLADRRAEYKPPTQEPSPAPPPTEAPAAPAVSPPAAAAKVETEVAKVATTEGQRSAKDIKSELVQRLENLIEGSPEAKDTQPTFYTDVKGKRHQSEPKVKLEKVQITIPGDGDFTVFKTKENLTELLKRAKKISTAPGAPTAIKKSGIPKEDREWVAQQIAKGGESVPTTATAEQGFKGIAASARDKLDKPPALGDEGGFFTLHQAIYDTGAKLYQKGMSFASWAASMVRELGERVRAHLQDIWDRLTTNQPAMDPKAQSSRTELLSVIGMTPDEWVDYKRQQKTYGPDKLKELGAQVRLSDLGRMIEQRDALNAEYSRLLEEAPTDEEKVGVIQNKQNLLVKAQTLNELIQSATNIAGEIKDANQVRAFSGIPVPDIGYIWDQVTKAAGEFPAGVRKAWRSFSMQALPRITDSSRTAGEAGVRFASAPMVARAMGLDFAQRVTAGLKLPKDFDLKFGTGLTEDNLRDLKRIWHERALEAADRANIIQQLRDQIDDLSDAAKHGDQGAISETKQMTADIARLAKLTDLDAEDFQTKSDSVTTMIGAEASPFKNEQQYRDFMQSPQAQEAIRRHIAMWETEKDPLYRQANDLDPDMELQTRGLEYGARVNLKNLLRDQGTPTTVGPATRSPLIRATATLQKSDPFGRRAKGSGSYEGSYKEIMANGFGREYPVAKRHEFIRELLASGDAVLRNREYEPDLEIGGESTKAYPLKLRPWTGKFLHLKRSLAEEYEDAIGLSAPARASLYSKVAELATRSSVQGLAEGSTHISNLLSQVFTGLGPTGDPLLNALIKSAGRVDVLYSIPKILITAFSDRKHDMMKLAEIGAAKEPYRGGVGWLITKIDQGMRLYSADVYKKLAANGYVPDTETGLREYVNQVGNYNKRLQPRLIQHLRSTGFQPFATAMQTFNVQGLRTLTAAPGVEATSAVAHSKLMADKAANIMGFGVLVTALNLLVSGTATGPKGTKLGAVGWIGDDKRLHQLDIGSLTGISRGARITGIQAFTEAKRLGLPTQSALLSGAQGSANTAISTATGPMNRFIFMAATGKRPAIPAVQEAPVVPPQKDFSLIKNQVSANILEAAKQANPIVDFVVRAKQGKYEEAFSRQFSRYTPKTGMAVETIENLPKVVQASELNNYLDNLARESRKIPRGHLRMEFINDRIARDQMDETLRRRALEGLRRRGVFTR